MPPRSTASPTGPGSGIDIDPHPFDTHISDCIRYRDYLWAIWMVAASNMVRNGVYLSGKEARQQLENRFHQDFRTVDDALRPANGVVAGILTQLLLPPTGAGFGLGVAPGAITPRGARSARDYLDFLIDEGIFDPDFDPATVARADAEAGVTVPFGSAVNCSLVAGPVR